MVSKNSIIIFCQAPPDVQYTLSLYEQYKDTHSISIFVINVEGMFTFFQSCQLNVNKLAYIPAPSHRVSLKNPLETYRLKRELDRIKKEYFATTTDNHVFYFGDYPDLVTASCIHCLSAKNRIQVSEYMHVSPKRIKRHTVRRKIVLLLHQVASGAKLYYASLEQSESQANLMFFDSRKYGIVREKIHLNKSVLEKYSYRIKNKTGIKSLLLLESDEGCDYREYEKSFTEILQYFIHSGLKVYLKPHPRKGYSAFLKEYNFEILPSYVPAQFLAPEDYDYIVGVCSSVLPEISKLRKGFNVYSLIDLFVQKNVGDYEFYKSLLTQSYDGPVQFIESMEDLKLKIKA